MKKNNHSRILVFVTLFFVLALGTVLRFEKLTTIPPGLTSDEIANGYDAFTIMSTGRDHYGAKLPLAHIKSLGDYKLPLAIYMDVPFQKLLGPSILAIRFPSALFSSLTIFCVFLLGMMFFSSSIGLIAAALFAISPWDIFHAHLALETNPALFLSCLSLLFLMGSLKRKPLVIFALLSGILACYTHHNFWFLLPPLFITFFTIHKKEFATFPKKIIGTCIAILVVAVIPFILEGVGSTAARVNQSFFTPTNLHFLIQEAQKQCYNSVFVTRLTIVSYVISRTISHIFGQYSNAFSFITWYNPSRFDLIDVLPTHGLFYVVELPLFIIGFIRLLGLQNKKSAFLLTWLIIYPLPLILTGNLSAARMFHLLPLPQIIEAIGIIWLVRINKLYGVIVAIVLIFGLSSFLSNMWYEYPKEFSAYTEYGPLQVIGYLKSHSEKNVHMYIEETILDNNPLYYYYFFSLLPNEITRNSASKIKARIGTTSIVERGYKPPSEPHTYFISLPEDIPPYYKVQEYIFLKDGTTAYASVSLPSGTLGF
jgi:4-amino-4-deoxy-L-arabinose transferase-like glycosyltransferase